MKFPFFIKYEHNGNLGIKIVTSQSELEKILEAQ